MFSRDFLDYDKFGNVSDINRVSDFTFSIGYANHFFRNLKQLSLGIICKYASLSLSDERTSVMGIDFGSLYRLTIPALGQERETDNLSLGASVQNIGTGINYGYAKTSLPINVRIGTGYKFYKDTINLFEYGFEINIPNDSGIIISNGVEYTYKGIIQARMGYKISDRIIDSFTVGIGAGYKIGNKLRGEIDYALLPQGNFGITHVVSVTMKWD